MSMGAEGLPSVERAPAQIFDFEQLRDWAGFVVGAVRRHPWLYLATFLASAILALGLAKFLPRTYYTETSILAKRNLTISVLVNPERTASLDPEPPSPNQPDAVDSRTKAAAEEVLQHENLVSLIKQVNLLDRRDVARSPLLRLKDALFALVRKPLTEEDQLDALVGLLARNVSVNTEGGKVTIGVTWHEPQIAWELAEAAQRSFFEKRQREDLAHINDAISILEVYEKTAGEELKQTLNAFDQLFNQIIRARRRVIGDPRVLPSESENDQRLGQLRYRIRAKRRSIDEEEEQHSRRLAAAQAELVEQRAIYSADHPTVVERQRQVDALRKGSPQLETLRSEEQALMAEYIKLTGRLVPYPDEMTPDPFGLERVLVGILPAISENPQAALAMGQLQNQTLAHQALRRRLEMARMERDVVEASLKYRYTVLTPPDFPSRPEKPNALLIALGGVALGLLLGVFVALARDVLAGRILESWQVKRSLGLPVLAQFEPVNLGGNGP